MTAQTRGVAKVLVVDDSAMSRRILRRILDDAGHTVVEAADGASALASYELERPALVTLDLIMTGMDGLQVLIELRRQHPHARVIIATADLQRATRDEVMAAGACAVVNKPFSPEEVIRAVDSALAESTGIRPL